jgi:hypothetical protein
MLSLGFRLRRETEDNLVSISDASAVIPMGATFKRLNS